MKNWLILLLPCLVSVTFGASAPTKHLSNSVQIGDGLSTDKSLLFDAGLGASNPSLIYDFGNSKLDVNKDLNVGLNKLQVGTGHLKYDSGLNKLVFSHDGILEKKIGSGSGSGSGGINVLTNPGAEDGVTNWTNTGGTLTQESYTNSTEDNTKFFRFVATGSGQYVDSDLITFPDFIKGGCMADMKYVQGDNVFILKVIDQVPNEVSTGDLSDLTDWKKAPTQTFNCPTQGKIRIQSTGAGTIDFDDAYLGSNKGFIASESHASVIAYTPVTDGFGSISSTFFTYQLVGEMLHINGKFTTGTVDGNVAKVNLPSGFIIDNKGVVFNMIVGVHATYQTSSESGGLSLALDGDNFITFTSKRVFSNTAGSIGSDTGINTSASTRSFSFTAVVSVSSSQINNAQEAFTPEQADFFVDASLGGDNPAVVSASGVPFNSNLDLVLNSGSANVTCSDNSQGALVCPSGNEEIGIEVSLPRSGKYKVCFNAMISATDGGNVYYRIGHYQNLSGTIITLGDDVAGVQSKLAGLTNISNSRACGFFDISSVGVNTFKMYTESTDTTSATFVMDRSGTSNSWDGHWTVELVSHNVSRPIIQDMVSTSVSSGVRETSCLVTNNGVPTVSPTSGLCESWIDSLSLPLTGIVLINVKTGTFSSNPVCTGSAMTNARCVDFDTIEPTPSQIRVRLGVCGSTTENRDFLIKCTGAK